MKKHTILFVLSVLLMGCNHTDNKPKYFDFENAWESENLIGNVKTLEQYKAQVNNPETGEKDLPLIVFKKEFTENGNILIEEYYGDTGQISSVLKIEYDKNGKKIKSTSKSFLFPINSTVISEYNAAGNISTASIYQNDTLYEKGSFEYNSEGRLIAETSIRKADTATGTYAYKFDENGKIRWKKQTEIINNSRHENFIGFTYDKHGNLVEILNKAFYGNSPSDKAVPEYENKTMYEYDLKNRIRKTLRYESGEIKEEKEFDKYYNQVLVKYYTGGTLNREMKYEYEFDAQGNWIERKTFLKQHTSQDKNWIPVFVETRKIVYY